MLKPSLAVTLPKHVQKRKGSLAKTMALHARHGFWYISPTSAKHDINQVRLKSSESCFLGVTNSWPGSFD